MGRSLSGTYARDYHLWGDTTVTFISKAAPGGTDTSISVTDAHGHEYTASEVSAAQGLFQLGDKTWLLGADQVSAHPPKPGDSITDAGSVVWEVIDAKLDGFGISWECLTHKAR